MKINEQWKLQYTLKVTIQTIFVSKGINYGD